MTIDKRQGLIYKHAQLNGMLRTLKVGHLKFIPTVFTHGYGTRLGRGFYM
jgi:hypothetical protein